jgi:sphingosine kinase
LPILQAAGCNIVEQIPENRTDVSHTVTTAAAREATTIAQNLNLDHYDAILCIGGDGIVHEVINGLANRSDGMDALNRMCIATVPAGTNLYCSSNE